MLDDTLFIHLAHESILLSFDDEQQILSIRVGDRTNIPVSVRRYIEHLDFSADCACRWQRVTGRGELPKLVTTLADVIGRDAVWDAGKSFGTWDRVSFDVPSAPAEWHGRVAVRVCETGHAVLFDSSTPEAVVAEACREIHHRYLLREFHPSE